MSRIRNGDGNDGCSDEGYRPLSETTRSSFLPYQPERRRMPLPFLTYLVQQFLSQATDAEILSASEAAPSEAKRVWCLSTDTYRELGPPPQELGARHTHQPVRAASSPALRRCPAGRG